MRTKNVFKPLINEIKIISNLEIQQVKEKKKLNP